MIIVSTGLPPTERKAKETPKTTKKEARGILIKKKIGREKAMYARTDPVARYANCFMVMSPMSLNSKPVISWGIG